jgi:hypothetical protein
LGPYGRGMRDLDVKRSMDLIKEQCFVAVVIVCLLHFKLSSQNPLWKMKIQVHKAASCELKAES